MFRRLFTFGYQRTLVQAIGFYLVYLVGGIIISAMVSALLTPFEGLSGFDEGFAFGLQVGSVFAVLLTLALGFSIVRAKASFRHPGYLFVAVLSVGFAAV